ncbi:MAG: hypothetical protein OEZ10_08535 [Gammaproteobacteria bacterium]|nr:hypothetical protein [Gammaproteobacteria bacterium]
MTTFHQAMSGRFINLLSWDNLSEFWNCLRNQADNNWFIYAISETAPTQPSTREELLRFIDEIDSLLRREHDEDYCGIVYADDRTHPGFVKIYDPNNLGVVCGYSENPPPPGWILSRIPPEPLKHSEVIPGNRRRWWQRLWA